MAEIDTTVVVRFRAGKSWYLLLECGHWIHVMSSIAPLKGGTFACPVCNLPKFMASS